MRIWNFIAAVLVLFGLAAPAHGYALPVPFEKIGNLDNAIHQAALGTVGGRSVTALPQITCNLVTGVASVAGPCTSTTTCNGNKISATITISTPPPFSPLVTVFSNQFGSGDIGKAISIPLVASGGSTFNSTISAVSAFNGTSQTVTLSSNTGTQVTSQSVTVTYGSDDRPAFDAFNNWARANQGSNQVVLTIPNGSNCWFGTGTFNYVNTFNAWTAGIKNLIVEGTGATLDTVGGVDMTLGSPGICTSGLATANGCSARIQTVNPGDGTVTLTAASLAAGYVSRFPVGQWIMVGGLDIQGLFLSPFGDPPNNNYFEWRQVTAVNAGTGVVTLDRPLTKTFQSNWPNFNAGNVSQQDQGGAATIWALGNSGVGGTQNAWNTTQEFRGMTINSNGQILSRGRSMTFRNITFGNSQSAIPSQNESWSAYNSTFLFQEIEVDKLIGTLLMDGITIPKITFQSSSTDLFILRNSTITNRLDGGAKRTEISDSTLNIWGPGLFAYGNTAGASICTRCIITTQIDPYFASNYTLAYNPLPYTMSGGLLVAPLSVSGAQGPLVPGTGFFYAVTGYATIGRAEITTVTGDSWPAVDDQTATTNVTSTNGSSSITVSTAPFVSGDVGKVIIIPGARNSGGPADLRTYIRSVSGSGPQTIVVGDNATRSQSAVSQTVQWGTANTYAQTTAAGGLPDTSSLSANPLSLSMKGSPNFTCDTCTSSIDPNVFGMSVQAGATPGAPLASYIKRTFTPSSVAAIGSMPSRGKLVTLTIDVTQPFVGTGAPFLNPTGQFHNFTIKQSNYTQWDWFPTINLKQAGTRVITPSGVTCNGSPGACAGDTINSTNGFPPEAVWVTANIDPWTAGNFTGLTTAPTFTITMQTDQSP